MKKIVLILVSLIIILTGCSNKDRFVTKHVNNKDKFEIIKDKLKNIPQEYNLDSGINEGDFIIIHGNLKSDINIIREFVENSKSSVSSELTVVEYTIEGDPIITKVKFDGQSYYGVIDSTRDKYGSSDYYNFEYLYIKNYKESNEDIYYLVNNDSLTYDEVNYYMSKEGNYDVLHLFTIINR